jgi:hypothetical protein
LHYGIHYIDTQQNLIVQIKTVKCIMTLSITGHNATQGYDTQHADIQYNDTYNNDNQHNEA